MSKLEEKMARAMAMGHSPAYLIVESMLDGDEREEEEVLEVEQEPETRLKEEFDEVEMALDEPRNRRLSDYTVGMDIRRKAYEDMLMMYRVEELNGQRAHDLTPN